MQAAGQNGSKEDRRVKNRGGERIVESLVGCSQPVVVVVVVKIEEESSLV